MRAYLAYHLLRALARVGEYELVFELIISGEDNSWANMVKEGASACFEVWSKYNMHNVSLCHGWACAPIPIIIEEVISLKPGKPGWTEVDFSPRLPAGLKELTFECQVTAGRIRVESAEGNTTMRLL